MSFPTPMSRRALIGAAAAAGAFSLVPRGERATAAPMARTNRPVAMLAPAPGVSTLALRSFRTLVTASPVPYGHLPNENGGVNPMTAPAGSHFDANGVLQCLAPDGKYYLHPVSTCQYAMGQLRSYQIDHNPQRLAIARKQADALAGAFIREGSAAYMPYQFDWSYYGEDLGTPWYSGMAQGFGVQLMTWLAQLTGNKVYLQHADSLFDGFLRPYAVDSIPWVAGIDNNSMLWLDEYPRHKGQLSKVFNGHCFATLGLMRYWQANVTGLAGVAARPDRASQVLHIIEGGLSTAKQYKDVCRIPGNASSYVVSRQMPHPKYHPIHIMLLQMIYDITGDPGYATTMDAMIHDYRDFKNGGTVEMQPGTYTLYQLGANGVPTASKTWRTTRTTSAPADEREEIAIPGKPRVPGLRISDGYLKGWVIPEIANHVYYKGQGIDAHGWLRPRTVLHPAGAKLTGASLDPTGRTLTLHRVSSAVATTSTSDKRACIHGQQRIHLITGPLAGLWVPEDNNSHYA